MVSRKAVWWMGVKMPKNWGMSCIFSEEGVKSLPFPAGVSEDISVVINFKLMIKSISGWLEKKKAQVFKERPFIHLQRVISSLPGLSCLPSSFSTLPIPYHVQLGFSYAGGKTMGLVDSDVR